MSKLLPVTKKASDYTEEELKQFRKQFAVTIERMRRKVRSLLWICIGVGLAFILDIVTLVLDHQEHGPGKAEFLSICVFWFLFLLFWACVILVIFYYRQPECPACHNRLNAYPLGDYCPECGSNQLEKKKIIRYSYKCRACGKRLKWGKYGKHFRIRICTHCGIFLDEKGF